MSTPSILEGSGSSQRDEALGFRFDEFEIDLGQQELRRSGQVVRIEPQVFELLVYLVRNSNRVVTKEELIELVWRGRAISEAALSSCVSAARRAIGDTGKDQRRIRTASKRGFRFVGTIDDAMPPQTLLADIAAVQESSVAAIPAEFTQQVPGAQTLTLPDKPSIAVLPFQNMSGDPEQEYFADGLTEDIITGLSRQSWFFVIARNSSFTYKGEAVDVRKVASQLGVRYVLEGSVRKAADRVRVTAQLIDAATRHSFVGGQIRSPTGRHLQTPGRDHEPGHWFGRPANPCRRGGSHPPHAATEFRRMGPGHAGAALHVARHRGGPASCAGISAAGDQLRFRIRSRPRAAGMDLCQLVQSGCARADQRVHRQSAGCRHEGGGSR